MLFLQVLGGVFLAVLALVVIFGSLNLFVAISEKFVRPALMWIWSWCRDRNIPFPNLWESIQGLATVMLSALFLWMCTWITIGVWAFEVFYE